MDIDVPEVKAELEAAFAAYEAALVDNDVAALDAFFLEAPHVIRYGVAENLYGHAEIAAFRAARSPAGLARSLARTVVTTYGRDFGVAATLFRRDNTPAKVGRQMQSWVRMAGQWRIVAAHVSIIDDPDHPAHRG
ncbi:MAG: oxalurate catabolism protein HpxZ [Alphaproteobacteria bacterium]